MPGSGASDRWTWPEYEAFAAAITARTGGRRSPTLGELLSRERTPGQEEATSAAWLEFQRKRAASAIDSTLRLEFSPTQLLGRLVAPEDSWERGRVPHPPATDARGVGELASPKLTAKRRQNRLAAFREAAASYGGLADLLEERLEEDSTIRPVK